MICKCREYQWESRCIVGAKSKGSAAEICRFLTFRYISHTAQGYQFFRFEDMASLQWDTVHIQKMICCPKVVLFHKHIQGPKNAMNEMKILPEKICTQMVFLIKTKIKTFFWSLGHAPKLYIIKKTGSYLVKTCSIFLKTYFWFLRFKD